MTTVEFSMADGGVFVVRFNGALDMEGTLAVENEFVFNVVTQKQGVLVDLSGVDFMASIGIRMLLGNAKVLHNRGGTMALLSPQPPVRAVLDSTGISPIIEVFDDEAAAIRHLSRADNG